MNLSRLKPAQLETLATCAGFVRGVLGIQSYEWAERVFADLDKRGAAVAVKAANGSGKTQFVAAPAVLWHASVFPRSLAIVTSGCGSQ